MAKILTSSANERIRSCRRDLVLELVTKHGPFWLTIDSLRRRWSIAAPPMVPPELPQEQVDMQSNPVYRPESWPDRLLQSGPFGPNGAFVTIEERPSPTTSPEVWAARCEVAWWVNIERLHQEFVPASCTREGPAAKLLWAPFLSACLLYDPPRWGMLKFADIPPLVFDLPPLDASARPESAGEATRMLAAPIVYLQDPDLVREAVNAYWQDVLDLLAERLRQSDIDIWVLVKMIVDQNPDMVERALARDAAISARAYINVTNETTDEDVRQAARLLRMADFSGSSRGGAPKTHPLIDIQCAVWHDEYKLPFPEIAKIFGWTISADSYGQPISESARRHVAQGREILQKRSIAG